MAGRKKQLKSRRKIRTRSEPKGKLSAKQEADRLRKNRRRTKTFRKRSQAALKGWVTRRKNSDLVFKGIELERAWEGKSRDGGPTGYFYERYTLPILDAGTVDNIIAHVKQQHPNRPFFVGGQVDFRDGNEQLFTNNATLVSYADSNAGKKIVNGLQYTSLNNSNPFQTGRSQHVDIEGYFVLVRFQRAPFIPLSQRVVKAAKRASARKQSTGVKPNAKQKRDRKPAQTGKRKNVAKRSTGSKPVRKGKVSKRTGKGRRK